MIATTGEESAISWTLQNAQVVIFRPATVNCWAALQSLAYVLRCISAHGKAQPKNAKSQHAPVKLSAITADEFTIVRAAVGEDPERSRQRLLVELHALESQVNTRIGFVFSRGLVSSLSSLLDFSFFSLQHLLAALLFESAMREGVNLTGVQAVGGVPVQRCRLLLAHSFPIVH